MNKLIQLISSHVAEQEGRPLVFIFWGNPAQAKMRYVDRGIDKKNLLTWSHPSPLVRANQQSDNENNFLYCDNFAKCNEILEAAGRPPIAWGSIE